MNILQPFAGTTTAMTKRKTAEEKAARKEAGPRKRVAVSVYKSAATKAMHVF